MLRLHLSDEAGEIPKKPVSRNANGKATLSGHCKQRKKQINLKALREVIGSTALSFASEEQQQSLGLSKGR